MTPSILESLFLYANSQYGLTLKSINGRSIEFFKSENHYVSICLFNKERDLKLALDGMMVSDTRCDYCKLHFGVGESEEG